MTVKFNEAFFEQLSTSAEVTGLCMGIAEEVAADARQTAPVGKTGDYKAGIHTELKHQRRSVALVVASDPKSILIESKTGNLARALMRAGRRHRG